MEGGFHSHAKRETPRRTRCQREGPKRTTKEASGVTWNLESTDFHTRHRHRDELESGRHYLACWPVQGHLNRAYV